MTTDTFIAPTDSAKQSSVRETTPWTMLRAAAIAAIPVEMLLRAQMWGINLPLATLCVAAAMLYATREREQGARMRVLLAATLVLLSSIVVFRAESLLWLAVAFAMVVTLAMMALPDAERLARGEPVGGVVRGVRALLQSASGPLRLLQGDVEWRREAPARGARGHVRGLAWAIPVVIPFLLLFASADPVFASLVQDLVDVPRILSHIALWGVFAWLVTGWLGSALLPWGATRGVRSPIGTRETLWVLGALTFVFDVFVALQVRWFFGGDALPRYMSGLTYAEYARRGFFELVTAGALLLAVLLLADWATRDAERDERRQVRLLSWLLLGLLSVVLASALMRMRLYIDVYGLTQLRFFTMGFMVWLVAVFAWFGGTILRGRRDVFVPGVYVSGVVAVFALAAIDPIERIAVFNVERAAETGRFDVGYAAELGDDALPTLVAALPRIPEAERCALRASFERPGARHPELDWRSFNVARARADEVRASLVADPSCAAATAAAAAASAGAAR